MEKKVKKILLILIPLGFLIIAWLSGHDPRVEALEYLNVSSYSTDGSEFDKTGLVLLNEILKELEAAKSLGH
ncbi:hypothetical protein A9Q99_25595, partial [Gammaproteobacteria bacterium 45_16_T64]